MAPFETNSSSLRLAADIGGTFTDVAVFDEATGKLNFGKALSTPHRLVDGINNGVAKAGTNYSNVGLFLHGSTIAINTILERNGAKTALIITKGFRDIYEIGRINRPELVQSVLPKARAAGRARLALRGVRARPGRWRGRNPARRQGSRGARREAQGPRHGSGRDPVPSLLPQRGSRKACQGHPGEKLSRDVRFRLSRIVAGISRVRALLDRGRQRLYRSQGRPLYRRDR